jgi:hypothetical protein
MSSHHHASNSSKPKSKLNVIPFKRRPPMAKQDFQIDNHGSIVLLRPLTEVAIDWVNEHIGEGNGFQPYWPVVVFEPRYLDHYIAGIRRDGLVAR